MSRGLRALIATIILRLVGHGLALLLVLLRVEGMSAVLVLAGYCVVAVTIIMGVLYYGKPKHR